MSNDQGMIFEKTFIKIFGRPKTTIYFAGYYIDPDKITFKAMLLTMCVHEINYNPESYDEDALQTLRDYEKLASSKKNEITNDLRFLNFLYDYLKVI